METNDISSRLISVMRLRLLHLQGLHQLNELDLTDIHVTDTGVGELRSHCRT